MERRARLLVVLLMVAACTEGEYGAATSNGTNDTVEDDTGMEGEGEEGEGEPPTVECPRFDLAVLPACCDDGEAHCVPPGSYPALLEDAAEPCAEGGICVPDAVIEGGTGYTPPSCSSIAGAEGVCVSICVPEVRVNAGLLPTEGCGASERCVPCVNPLTNEDTGVCATLACEDDRGGEGEGEGEQPAYSCDNPPTQPVVDPAQFGACCDGAHCVPNALVPADQAAMLSACDGEAGRCVPDRFIETAGLITPNTCSSVAGIEGRCLSTCLPDVAAQAAQLPQATCEASERCVPCCDPFTGEETGACSVGCDPGPAIECGPPAFPTCCDDNSGHCVPAEVVPEDDRGNLQECPAAAGGDGGEGEPAGQPAMLCVPDVMQDPAFEGADCVGRQIFGGDYRGVCLPDCLNLPFEFTMDYAACEAGRVCVPCDNPLTGEPTGAPGC